MPETKGYIKLHRSILSWEWYCDVNTRALFMHLLLCACWEDTPYMGRVIKRGQLFSTVKELSKQNGLTIKQTRTALAHLQTTGEITVDTTPHFSIFTIVNYNAFQGDNAGANKGQTEFAEKGKPNGKPKSPQAANGTAPANGDITAFCGGTSSESGKPESTEAANQTANKGQTEIAEKGKPTLLYKKLRNIRREEYSAELRRLIDEAVSEYNAVCTILEPFGEEISYQQAQLIVKAQSELHGISFREYFTRAAKSEFLTGRGKSSFKADFNWLIRPENVAKVLSGKYDTNYSSGNAPPVQERVYNADDLFD